MITYKEQSGSRDVLGLDWQAPDAFLVTLSCHLFILLTCPRSQFTASLLQICPSLLCFLMLHLDLVSISSLLVGTMWSLFNRGDLRTLQEQRDSFPHSGEFFLLALTEHGGWQGTRHSAGLTPLQRMYSQWILPMVQPASQWMSGAAASSCSICFRGFPESSLASQWVPLAPAS